MNRLVRCIVFLCSVVSYLPCHAAGSPWLLNADSLHPRFAWSLPQSAAGIAPEHMLSLHLLRGDDTAELAVAAAYAQSGAQLHMELLTGLEYGGRYLLRWRTADGARTTEYKVPARPRSVAATLTSWFPQTDSVPANFLFFQVRFSKPMRPDVDAWSRVRIREAGSGTTHIPFAWRQRSYWYDSDRVLQVMVHPGRVKRGIDYGGPLVMAGHEYIVEIDSGLTDAAMNVLPAQRPRVLRIGSADRGIPYVKMVTSRLDAGSADAIEIRFSEPMDYCGLLSGIFLYDAKRRPVPFRIEVSEAGRMLRMIPAAAWKRGPYMLELDSEIRDLGANTLRRPFEIQRPDEAAKDHMPCSYRILVR